jgi:hypothetical protein
MHSLRGRDALQAAAVALRALAHYGWSHHAPVRVRMEIHSGELLSPTPTDAKEAGLLQGWESWSSAISRARG